MARTGPEVHHTHRDVSGGWLRPAVFGAMDGLVSNAALVAGVAGGSSARHAVLLAGLAGLCAGAFSMAAGEYISVASQSELAQAEIEVERAELAANPRGERLELVEVYVARGVDRELARQVVDQLSRDPEQALAVHVREELGLDADALPSPLLAAGSSFVSFALGAVLPVLPYLLGAGLAASVLTTLVALFAGGAVVAQVTARPWWFSGSRQLVLGGAALALTYAVGQAVGGVAG
ncbi:VIT1/CCC1 family predicted Fe2+/Mn2+ transporter [Motilibacter peucedani]|uniref:VIT1/CCC1 family predicted Fe2+/Mn2+ transporter n=1 Tax=Motilibacter peucedani TaxID=598650 RepID=A0A420XVP5_9ACTN|nr:VIT1/CCC1 transporter family protein [Motilibacter peucedani]RKS84244.1 VIT1/CCC1 family predicted Fe2+/Mn2+ transporter [Motilibacter peucedani]